MRWSFFFTRLFRRDRLDADMDDEIRFHLAERTAELRRFGLDEDEARRRARLDFGAVENFRTECRETRRFHLLHDFFEDMRFGVRLLRRNPGFSLLALFCLTIGIGANATVFSWIEGILLRPYPLVAHQERMMALTSTERGVAGAVGNASGTSWPDFQDFRRECSLFDAFIVSRITGTTLSIGDRAERATGSIVSANYFDALGVPPIMGRGFLPEEDTGRNAHPVAVISYRLWQSRYHGDPAIVGKTQVLNGVRHTIVGVAPQGFDGTFVGWAINFWVPVSMQETFEPGGYMLEDRGARWIEGFAIRKPGVTEAQAQAELSAVAQRLETAYPQTNRNRGAKLYPLWQTPFNGAGLMLPTLSVALAVVIAVLLIVCANVSNLLLVRGLARRHEMGVRLAIGARQGRLLRQLLTEGLLLSILAAIGGLLLANWSRNLMILMIPPRAGLRVHMPGEVDWRVMMLSVALCIGSAIVFGLVPAAQSSRIDLAGALKAESAGVVGGHRRGLLRSSLVLVQVALSFVLLVATGLLLQSMRSMQNASPGFALDHVLTSGIDFVAAGYDPRRIRDFQDQLVERVRGLPGVESAAVARIVPFGYRGYTQAPVTFDGSTAPADDLPNIAFNEVGPDYLATMGIPLLSGREFTRADDESAPPVAIVNQTLAEQFWPGQNPIGRRIRVKDRWMQVIGVAHNAKVRSLTEAATPFFYVPVRQNAPGGNLELRTTMSPQAMAQALVREIHALDANLAPVEVITMREQVERTMAPQRIALGMISAFGALALLLATVGLYGVMSYTVSQSTRELGLRMALGAAPRELVALVMKYGFVLTAIGVSLGVTTALALSRLLGYLLYGVSPRDPIAFAAAFVAMTFASCLACFVPAWRAARIDPLRALRT
jgi:predicted permease